jgi:hypothetical protein
MTKIAKRLDPNAEGIDVAPKPKGMHWRTYDRLANRYQAYDDLWVVALWRRWGRRIAAPRPW